MRTTLHIDDTLLATAAELTGVREKTALVRMGLVALVARASAQRLALLAGSEKRLRAPRRRRATRVARTIDNLAGEPRVGALRLAEALRYRAYEARHTTQA